MCINIIIRLFKESEESEKNLQIQKIESEKYVSLVSPDLPGYSITMTKIIKLDIDLVNLSEKNIIINNILLIELTSDSGYRKDLKEEAVFFKETSLAMLSTVNTNFKFFLDSTYIDYGDYANNEKYIEYQEFINNLSEAVIEIEYLDGEDLKSEKYAISF